MVKCLNGQDYDLILDDFQLFEVSDLLFKLAVSDKRPFRIFVTEYHPVYKETISEVS